MTQRKEESHKISMEKEAKEKIEKGLFYEAHQLVKIIINRKLQKKDFTRCINVLFYFSSKFVKEKQYVISCDLMYQSLVILMENEIEFNEQYAEKIIQIFNKCPPNTTEEKYKFMNKAISWSKDDDDICGYIEFHRAIGVAYFEEQSYAIAHNHLIFLDDNELLFRVICAWRNEGYPSERDFFVLRSVLSLVVLGKYNQALELIQMFEPNLDKPDVNLPIQVAYLITNACIHKSLPLYEDVKYKYRLILSYDREFTKFLDEIDSAVFNKKKNDLFSLFHNMFTQS